MHVSAAEAANLVRRHERIVRGRIARGQLPAVKEGTAWRIAISDLERIPGWRVDRSRLAQLEEQGARSVESLTARIAYLERDVRELRTLVRALTGAHAPQTHGEGQERPVGGLDVSAYPQAPVRPPDGHERAPAAYSLTYAGPPGAGVFRTAADARRWLARHGISPSTPKSWVGWPPPVLAPGPVLDDALRRYDHRDWRITWRLHRCDDPSCVCQEVLSTP